MISYAHGFEENEKLRSEFVRQITTAQMARNSGNDQSTSGATNRIPKTIIQYWHDPIDLPDDVSRCMSSWAKLAEDGFTILQFNDKSARGYIEAVYEDETLAAFDKCTHPAMRCDFFRMCYLLAEGGVYVDADDILLDKNLPGLLQDDKLKIHPLCFCLQTYDMLPNDLIWQPDLSLERKIFYFNNDPIISPPQHPVLKRALSRATNRLLDNTIQHEIQETTGPGNLTASLVAHANDLLISGQPVDFTIMNNWEDIAKVYWHLSYRQDARNWRNFDFYQNADVKSLPT